MKRPSRVHALLAACCSSALPCWCCSPTYICYTQYYQQASPMRCSPVHVRELVELIGKGSCANSDDLAVCADGTAGAKVHGHACRHSAAGDQAFCRLGFP
jgi:hypothetical protein